MGIVIRQGIKGTTVAYVGVVMGAINTLFLMPHFFSFEQIGLIRLLQDIPLLIASFAQIGAVNIIDRFFPYFKTDDKKNNGLLMFLIVYALIGYLLFSVLFSVFYQSLLSIFIAKSPLLTTYFYFILPLVLLMMLNSIFESYCKVHFRIVVPTIIREVVFRGFFFVITILFGFKYINLEQFIMLLLVTYGLSLLLIIIYAVRLKILHFSPNWQILTKPLVRNIASYVAYIIPGSAGGLVISKLDIIFLGASKGLANTGIYSLSFFIGSVVDMPRRAISQISVPIIAEAWKINDFVVLKSIYSKSSINLFVAGLIIFLCIWLNIHEIIYLIPASEQYVDGKYVILIIGIGKLLDLITGVNSELLLNSVYFKFNLIAMFLLSGLTILFNIFLIPTMGIIGAALSFSLSLTIFNLAKLIYLWKKAGIQPFIDKTLEIVLLAIGMFLLSYIIPYNTDNYIVAFVYIILKSAAIIVFITLFLYFRNISTDINSIIDRVVNMAKNKFFNANN